MKWLNLNKWRINMSPKHQESIRDKKDTILCMVSRVPRHQKKVSKISVETSWEVSDGYSNGLFCCSIDGEENATRNLIMWVWDKIVVIF